MQAFERGDVRRAGSRFFTQDPSVIAPDATIACNQASFSSVAKNLGRNSLKDGREKGDDNPSGALHHLPLHKGGL